MSITVEPRRRAAPGTVAAAYTELLAGVLRVDHVPIDSHFFDDLGADSLVMAQFCARVRKRGNLPPVSMRDVYQHPTIRGLAAALARAAPGPAKLPAITAVEAPTTTRPREYIVCGALQALFFLAYSYVVVVGIAEGYRWVSGG